MKLWFGIVTTKLEASKDFYTRLFGAELVFEADWFVLLQMGQTELGFMAPGLDTMAPIFQPAYAGQGVWITLEVPDVDAEYARLRALGVPVVLELRDEPWGDRHFTVADPNGIGVDIVTRQEGAAAA